MVLNIRRELVAHLRGDEGVGNMLALEVLIQRHQVEAQFLRDDMHGGPARQRRIDALLMHVKTVAGIFSHIMFGLQVVVFPIPVTVTDEVSVGELAAFGHACGTGGVKEDE